ncbi:MAG TPA: hypothetical protein VLW85_02680 [Myxococcales bacterium]|nr:hypothetical protein [Myxococcales bacterium]
MGGDEREAVSAQEGFDADAREPKILCYVNHFYGPSPGFHGKSTSAPREQRRAAVERTVASLRHALPGATVRVCGIPGRALVPLDEEFHLEDPRLLVYESLDRMAGHLDGYDWFVNIEDDIEFSPRVFHNALAFEGQSLSNECLLPNRLEQRAEGLQCVDMQAIPGWTLQERRVLGHTFRVALNPHSALLMLSREKLAFALRQVDRSFRGPVLGGPMASAYAHYHKPFSLYRCFDDPAFHSVLHQDSYEGPLPPGARLDFSAVLLSWKRAHNLPAIVRSLQEVPQVREILVWNNDASRRLEVPGATVVNAPRNFMCLARYGLTPLARHDNIWFQDDDLVLRPDQFAALLDAYARDPSRIYGARGRNLRDGHYVFEDAYGDVDIVLGQTMMFHRSLLRHAFETLGAVSAPIVEDDIVFSLSCRRKHVAVNVEPLQDLGMSDDAALFRLPGHAERRQAAVDRVLAHIAAQPQPEREIAALRGELEQLRAAHAQLSGSATVRAANAVKRLPLVYPAYLRGKQLLATALRK